MSNSLNEKAAWQKLAFGTGSQQPPLGGPPALSAGGQQDPPSLTQIFNAAAKPAQVSAAVTQPVSKQQIKELCKRLSQPRYTLEMTPMGSLTKAYRPEADRRLLETMTALTELLAAKKGLSSQFSMAAKKGELKKDFNRSSLGRGF